MLAINAGAAEIEILGWSSACEDICNLIRQAIKLLHRDSAGGICRPFLVSSQQRLNSRVQGIRKSTANGIRILPINTLLQAQGHLRGKLKREGHFRFSPCLHYTIAAFYY